MDHRQIKCQCGCGAIVKQGNKYILGHNGILNRGRVCSENKKQKLRLANIGKKHSQESINKRIESRLWYRHSEETRIAIGNGNRG